MCKLAHMQIQLMVLYGYYMYRGMQMQTYSSRWLMLIVTHTLTWVHSRSHTCTLTCDAGIYMDCSSDDITLLSHGIPGNRAVADKAHGVVTMLYSMKQAVPIA